MSGDGPFTVFAPTVEAFAKLPEVTIETLLEDISQLTNILYYHVVPGKVYAADVIDLEEVDTALENEISIKVENGKVFINESQATITDVIATNGIIHGIKNVHFHRDKEFLSRE